MPGSDVPLSDAPEARRRTELLQWLVLTSFIALLAAVGWSALVEGAVKQAVLRYGPALAALVLTHLLLRRHGVEAAGRFFVTVGLVIVLGLAWVSGGLRGPALVSLLLVLVLAGFVLGNRAVWIAASVEILGLIVLYVAERGEWLPEPILPVTAERIFMSSLVAVSATAVVVTQSLRAIRGSTHLLEEESARARSEVRRRENAEAKLLHAQKLEAVGQLAGGIAHDFNNLLTVISGNLSLADELADAGSDLEELIGAAKDAAGRGAELTRRILAFSRRQPLNPQAVQINDLVRSLDPLFRRTLGASYDIELVLGAGLWPSEVDAAQLESALLNLCLNARDAMPDGGRLTVETANARLDEAYAARNLDCQPGQYAMLAVTDTGEGMSPDVLTRAVEPFFTTKDVGKGSGLGLSMVFGFVKQSGGHVALYSEVGKGTTVKLYLPRSRAGAVALTQDLDEAPAGGSERVLVVEDDPHVRKVAVDILVGYGYQVDEAEDVRSALEVYERSPPDIVVVDVVLPGERGGADLAKMLIERRPALPILFVSGYTENAIVHHGRLDPGVELLEKPFNAEDLARRVRRLLDARDPDKL